MSLTVRGSFDSGFKPVPPGMFLARCYKIIDLGTQKTSYKGLEKMQKKVTLQFEVHGEDEDGNPVVTAKGEPCGGADPDTTCPLDTWVILLVIVASAFAAYTLYRRQAVSRSNS